MFEVKFQLIDYDIVREKEIVVFETISINGGFNKEQTYDQYHLFNLEEGSHKLYLKVINNDNQN